MKSGAVLSTDRKYRYLLWRRWDDDLPAILFIGLNPSTADEKQDDPTIRRCIAFSKSWGYGTLLMVNLFAFRATDPIELKTQDDPIGLHNDYWTRLEYERAQARIAAWGTKGSYQNRNVAVRKLLPDLFCLGLTNGGHPKHPLYLPKNTKIIPYREGVALEKNNTGGKT